MNEKKLYLVFSQTYSIPSRIIKSFTKKPYSHVSISFDNNFDCMYSFGRRSLRNFFHAGFIKENIKEGVFRFNEKAYCIIYELSITEEQKQKILEFVDRMSRDDYQYNMLGALLIPFNIRLQRKNKYYCSEFVYNSLCYANILNDDRRIIIPHHLMNINNLELYYAGNIKDIK
jgi:uncharacterized protein YycO